MHLYILLHFRNFILSILLDFSQIIFIFILDKSFYIKYKKIYLLEI